MSTVTFQGVRVNDSDANSGWTNWNSGGGAPASEPQRVYQGSGVVGKKSTSSSTHVGVAHNATAQVDTTAVLTPLILLKGTVDDNADLQPTDGVRFAIGNSNGVHYEYVVSGSDSPNDWHKFYNAVGGVAAAYLFAAIDISVAGWRDAASPGGVTATAIDFYAMGGRFVGGAAKNENMGLDAIDAGWGLRYSGTAFTFQDAVAEDQDIENNRWGWAALSNGTIVLRGMHEILVGDGSVDASVVSFPDGMHSAGQAGVRLLAGADVELAGFYSGLGRNYPGVTDTRPDLSVQSTAVALLSGSFRNWRLLDVNATTTITGQVECESITGGPLFDGARVVCNQAAGVATIVDPDFSRFTSTRLTQGGAGHAIEITTPGTYNIDELRGLTEADGWGPDETTSAAIYNNSLGLVTLVRADGSTPVPTVRNGVGATTVIPAVSVTVTFSNLVVGAEFRIYDADADGVAQTLGSDREGVEALTASSYVMLHDGAEVGQTVFAQQIDSSVEEEVIEVTLAATPQTIAFQSKPEENI